MPETFPRRVAIANTQMNQFRDLLDRLFPGNAFYSQKFNAAGTTRKIPGLRELYERVPFTLKEELVQDQRTNPPYGTNLTYPLDRYTRCHQTSGTSGQPLRWLDTAESWEWMLGNWAHIYRAAGVTQADRIFFAFSFGPFLGFWTAFESALRIRALCLTGGGMSSVVRLRAILDQSATVLCCTPTYAIHLGEMASTEGIDLSASQVKRIIVAGEPGGSVPAVRARLEQLWPGARVFDHHGMTEVGPVSFECPARTGVLHIIETSYIPEIIDPQTLEHVEQGVTGELVLTNLGRIGSPLLRYRTGDLVRASHSDICECGRCDLALEGGILGRTDDMVVVRGVNVYPNAVDEIIRACGNITEYQVNIDTQETLTDLRITIEPAADVTDPGALTERLEKDLQSAFSLRVPVTSAAHGTLPRFEMKAKRWVKRGQRFLADSVEAAGKSK
jgi:phenylacetate-CoA ligase